MAFSQYVFHCWRSAISSAAHVCIASCLYYSLSSRMALFQSGVCSVACNFSLPTHPPWLSIFLLSIGPLPIYSIVFPLKFLFQCDWHLGSVGAGGSWLGCGQCLPSGWSYILGQRLLGKGWVRLSQAPDLHFCDNVVKSTFCCLLQR